MLLISSQKLKEFSLSTHHKHIHLLSCVRISNSLSFISFLILPKRWGNLFFISIYPLYKGIIMSLCFFMSIIKIVHCSFVAKNGIWRWKLSLLFFSLYFCRKLLRKKKNVHYLNTDNKNYIAFSSSILSKIVLNCMVKLIFCEKNRNFVKIHF